MASTKEYLDYVCDLCREVSGITTKKMMGEYLMYQNGVLFGGVYDDRFLLKKTASNNEAGLKESIPYEGAKPMWQVETEDAQEVADLIKNAVHDLAKK